ncbi:MAG: hypothetical protein ACJ78Q_11565 [Chloroflexia bacterium]
MPATVQLRSSAGPTPGRHAGREAMEEVCVANIGPRQRRQRLSFGLVSLAVGVGLAAVLIVLHAPPLLRLGLFVPFVLGTSGFFQAYEKT